MRSLAGLATVLIGATAATAAGAQTLSSPTGPQAAAQTAAILNDAAFAPKSYDPGALMLGHDAFEVGAGEVRWQTSTTSLSHGPDGPVDQLRVSVGGALRTPYGLPVARSSAQFDAQAYEVAVTRDWPGAVSFEGKSFGLDVSPHAGVGMTNAGGSAEAGAMVELSRRQSLSETAADRLKALGLRDGAHFGDKGRWYLFAAASGRAVGLNMLHSDTGWDRAGWSQDATSTLVGDAQVGVGFRKGPVQTSLGYMHREVKGPNQLWGVESKADSMVAFSLSIKPRR